MATFRVHVDDDATMVGVLAERWHQDPTCNATLAILTNSVCLDPRLPEAHFSACFRFVTVHETQCIVFGKANLHNRNKRRLILLCHIVIIPLSHER